MKEYRVTINVRLHEVEQKMVHGPSGQQGMGERVLTVQVTEGAGVGPTPKAALEEAMGNGIEAYLQGMMEASDRTELLAPPGKGKREGH
ncbi:hypothetical protein LCGC14_2363520 [marine sediment metagenome]|uniref:Uncharacterized protein n=1 Tax=marine sediment metagenome TaxID=412755 RepID=A0A0F9C5S9_9ZZZZ